MYRVAEFYKVDFEIFFQDYLDCFNIKDKEIVREIYDTITIPKRATTGSAGYDFVLPTSIKLLPGETVKIPTGIRSNIQDGWVLMLFPRSSLGFKFRLQLNNTVGIIDSDYYACENQGHILIKITNDSKEHKVVELDKGQAFVQGIFLPYGITESDNIIATRNGGLGSTDRK